MRKIIFASIVGLLLLNTFSVSLAEIQNDPEENNEFLEFVSITNENFNVIHDNFRNQYYDAITEKLPIAPGELLIKFKDDENIDMAISSTGYVLTGIQTIDDINNDFRVINFETAIDGGSIELMSDVYKFEFEDEIDLFEAIEMYINDPSVEFVEPNYLYELLVTPNDPYFGEQWALHNTGQNGGTPDADIDAPPAWDITMGDEDVVICILDTGVDTNHDDLKDNIIPGYDDGDWHGHGSFCSGIAAGVSNNDIGIAGIASQCKIMPKKGITDQLFGLGTTQEIIGSLIEATNEGAHIISMSLGGPLSETLKLAINYANRKGVVLVAAAGNDNNNLRGYPAAYDGVIAVAATDNTDSRAFFSSYGAWVDLAAPGVDIKSTWKDNNYLTASGTSASCPHVAGVAALLLSENKQLTSREIKTILKSSTEEVDSEYFIGTGRINADLALEKSAHVVAEFESSIDGKIVMNAIDIKGTARGLSYKGYKLEYAKGIYPEETDWVLIKQSTNRVYGGKLGQLDTSNLDEDVYSIRLTVENGDYTYIDLTTILIDNDAETLYVENDNEIKFKVNEQRYFEKINDAIMVCGDKDTVFVKSGTYNEVITVGSDRKINLIGENKETTILDSSGINASPIAVYYGKINIEGFTIIPSESEGFLGIGISDCNICDNIFQGGVVTIISLSFASNNIISNNIFSDGGIAFLGLIRNSKISDNNLEAIDLLLGCSKNDICNNNVEGDGDSLSGITLCGVLNNNIYENTISNCDFGITLWIAKYNNINNNTISNCDSYGIAIWGGLGLFFNRAIVSTFNTISYNIITNNYQGIAMDIGKVKYNFIFGNEISDNYDEGIYIEHYEGFSEIKYNEIYLNNFINNGINNDINAYDSGTNIWYKLTLLRGNYWGDYEEEYPQAEPRFLIPEVWDTPYDIDGGDNQDLFPLVEKIDTSDVSLQVNQQSSSPISTNSQTVSGSSSSNPLSV